MNTNTNTLTLIIGDVVKNGIGTRVEELHHCDCADLKKTIKDSYFVRSFGTVEHFDSIESAREWYNDDPDELGWLFDDEVKVLPCVSKGIA